MANIFEIPDKNDDIQKTLGRAFQSANISFLIGAGASHPAIEVTGAIEQEIEELFESGKEMEANAKLYQFLKNIQSPTNMLIANENDKHNNTVLSSYREFLGIIETILVERKSNILPKQANIFTTNYDLFIEKASESYSALKLNDGFSRVPTLNNHIKYSPQGFFNSVFNNGNLYNYRVEIPSINLIKLHGSLSWSRVDEEIIFDVSQKDLLTDDADNASVEKFIKSYALVLPMQTKFRETLRDRIYYNLLRIYANELDKENALLVAFGFSFADEHIKDMTRRALKNPTLKLIIFAYSEKDTTNFLQKFDGYKNVDIFAPSDKQNIDFQTFNKMMRSFLPEKREA